MKLVFFNKRSGAVVMSPDSEGLGAAVVAGVAPSLTQSSGISYFPLYIYIHKRKKKVKVPWNLWKFNFLTRFTTINVEHQKTYTMALVSVGTTLQKTGNSDTQYSIQNNVQNREKD